MDLYKWIHTISPTHVLLPIHLDQNSQPDQIIVCPIHPTQSHSHTNIPLDESSSMRKPPDHRDESRHRAYRLDSPLPLLTPHIYCWSSMGWANSGREWSRSIKLKDNTLTRLESFQMHETTANPPLPLKCWMCVFGRWLYDQQTTLSSHHHHTTPPLNPFLST